MSNLEAMRDDDDEFSLWDTANETHSIMVKGMKKPNQDEDGVSTSSSRDPFSKERQGLLHRNFQNLSRAKSWGSDRFPNIEYQRIVVDGDDTANEEDRKRVSSHLLKAMQIRKKYMDRAQHYFPKAVRRYMHDADPDGSQSPLSTVSKEYDVKEYPYHPPPAIEENPFEFDTSSNAGFFLRTHKGIVQVTDAEGRIIETFSEAYTTLAEFYGDCDFVQTLLASGPLRTFCYRRLSYLHLKFQMYTLLNDFRELAAQKSVSHRDFYNIRKVDNHVHAASCMNQKHLLRFMKRKVKSAGNKEVCVENGRAITLSAVFRKLNITPYDLSVDMLDVHADRDMFHRFDRFNAKYSPLGQSSLRDVFIKTDNHIEGEFFAELLKEVMRDLEDSKYQNAEYRLSIYGRSQDEWDKLAKWAVKYAVHSRNARWLIQVPRLYDAYRSKNLVKSFQEFVNNIFLPLFEVTNDPASHPELHVFLRYVVGLDSVDDETKPERIRFDVRNPTPDEWTFTENPAYSYYLYYMYANVAVLNRFRRSRGLNIIAFRPHSGEAGSVTHLVASFLTAESISHGLLLKKVPVMQYLYYLCQVGMSMSPLSNNSLFVTYNRNPLPEFLSKGLNVSLSTDDPLQFHFTKEPLMEEYSIAAQVWKLSNSDMCELARNSVMQSGFPHEMKLHWLGAHYEEDGVVGNDITRTNVPDIRVAYRHETLMDEFKTLFPDSLDQDELG